MSIILPALTRCKIKYDIQAVVPISSPTLECEEVCKSIKVMIINSFNLVHSGESSTEDEIDKFRKFLAENKNVLYRGYADEPAKSKSRWDNILGRMDC